jgi:hypothetical protein
MARGSAPLAGPGPSCDWNMMRSILQWRSTLAHRPVPVVSLGYTPEIRKPRCPAGGSGLSGVIAQGTLLAVAADPGRTQGRAAGMPILSIVTPPAAPRPPATAVTRADPPDGPVRSTFLSSFKAVKRLRSSSGRYFHSSKGGEKNHHAPADDG